MAGEGPLWKLTLNRSYYPTKYHLIAKQWYKCKAKVQTGETLWEALRKTRSNQRTYYKKWTSGGWMQIAGGRDL